MTVNLGSVGAFCVYLPFVRSHDSSRFGAKREEMTVVKERYASQMVPQAAACRQ